MTLYTKIFLDIIDYFSLLDLFHLENPTFFFFNTAPSHIGEVGAVPPLPPQSWPDVDESVHQWKKKSQQDLRGDPLKEKR